MAPCACEPWVKTLRTLIYPPHLLIIDADSLLHKPS